MKHKEIVQLIKQRLVRVCEGSTKEKDTYYYRGCGVRIGFGFVLTAYHVIEGKDKIGVQYITKNSKTRIAKEVEVSCIDEEVDLALLKVKELETDSEIDLSEYGVALGDELSTIRFVDTDKKSYTGYLKLMVVAVDDWVFYSDTPVFSGNSGSPIFNKKKELCGITLGKITQKDLVYTPNRGVELNIANMTYSFFANNFAIYRVVLKLLDKGEKIGE